MAGHNVLASVVRILLYTYRGCMSGVPLPWTCCCFFLQLTIIGIICQSFFLRIYLLSHKLVHWKITFGPMNGMLAVQSKRNRTIRKGWQIKGVSSNKNSILRNYFLQFVNSFKKLQLTVVYISVCNHGIKELCTYYNH